MSTFIKGLAINVRLGSSFCLDDLLLCLDMCHFKQSPCCCIFLNWFDELKLLSSGLSAFVNRYQQKNGGKIALVFDETTHTTSFTHRHISFSDQTHICIIYTFQTRLFLIITFFKLQIGLKMFPLKRRGGNKRRHSMSGVPSKRMTSGMRLSLKMQKKTEQTEEADKGWPTQGHNKQAKTEQYCVTVQSSEVCTDLWEPTPLNRNHLFTCASMAKGDFFKESIWKVLARENNNFTEGLKYPSMSDWKNPWLIQTKRIITHSWK